MKPSTARDYVALVRASKLLDDRTLYQSLDQLKTRLGADNPDVSLTLDMVSSYFLEEGLLTEWHHKQLLKGRHKGFFLGKYKLLRHLGSGGMSSVYLAEHRHMKRKAAVKILPQDRVGKRSYLERFLREAQAIAQLDHPNIVQAYEVDHVEQTYFLVMEFVEGQDLHRLVYKHGPLEETIAADYISQAASGLGHAHDRGLVHRDIKPANLLVDAKGTVKILDLGLALITLPGADELTLRHRENVIGTTDYMAPEQAIDSHHIDLRADVYGLGCTMYHLLSGNVPFPDASVAEKLMKHQKEEPKSLHDIRDDVSLEIVEICAKMMAKRPDDRYQNCHEVCDALQKLLRGSEVGSGSSSRFKVQEGSGSKQEFEQAATDIGIENVLINDSGATAKPKRKARSGSPPWLMIGGIAAAVLLAVGLGVMSLSGDASETPGEQPKQLDAKIEPKQPMANRPQPTPARPTPTLPRETFGTEDENLPALIRLQWPASERDNATLELNGKKVYPVGEEEVLLTVSPGSHRLSITRSGRDIWKKEVRLRPKQEEVLQVAASGSARPTTTPNPPRREPTEPTPEPPKVSGGTEVFDLEGGHKLYLFTDSAKWQQRVSDPMKFEFSPENLARAKSKPSISGDNVTLGELLEFEKGTADLPVDFSMQALLFEPWAYNEPNHPKPSLGIANTRDDDWQTTIPAGSTAIGLWLVGNRETNGESLEVHGTEDSYFYQRIPASALPAAGQDGKSFVGLVCDVPIAKLVHDENEGQDDLGFQAISFGIAK